MLLAGRHVQEVAFLGPRYERVVARDTQDVGLTAKRLRKSENDPLLLGVEAPSNRFAAAEIFANFSSRPGAYVRFSITGGENLKTRLCRIEDPVFHNLPFTC